jgi:hypothetical protein
VAIAFVRERNGDRQMDFPPSDGSPEGELGLTENLQRSISSGFGLSNSDVSKLSRKPWGVSPGKARSCSRKKRGVVAAKSEEKRGMEP